MIVARKDFAVVLAEGELAQRRERELGNLGVPAAGDERQQVRIPKLSKQLALGGLGAVRKARDPLEPEHLHIRARIFVA